MFGPTSMLAVICPVYVLNRLYGVELGRRETWLSKVTET